MLLAAIGFVVFGFLAFCLWSVTEDGSGGCLGILAYWLSLLGSILCAVFLLVQFVKWAWFF